jgi:hypothetical protein
MDLPLTFHLTSIQLRLINYCRLYLRIITVADITLAIGTHITLLASQGLQDSSCPSTLQWLILPCPHQIAWTQWNILLQFLSHQSKLLKPGGISLQIMTHMTAHITPLQQLIAW